MQVPYKMLKGTGIIAVIEGGKPGKHRVIRADIDGLGVLEEERNLKQKKVCVSRVEAYAMPVDTMPYGRAAGNYEGAAGTAG